MDWEKQDNELRKLMQDSEDFLPDDERWNKNASWQKIKKAKEPERKVIPVGMLRYAAAACLFCAISFFGIKYSSRFDKQPRQVKANKEIVVPVENEKTQSSDLVDLTVNNEENKLQKKQLVDENITLATTIDNKVNNDAKSAHEKPMHKPNDFGQMRDSGEKLITQNSEASNPETLVAKVVPEVEIPKPVEEVKNEIVASKKPMRVVHYNHLNQNNTISPPGFVKKHKMEESWASMALQNEPNQQLRDNPSPLRIELTPTIKKAL